MSNNTVDELYYFRTIYRRIVKTSYDLMLSYIDLNLWILFYIRLIDFNVRC